MTLTTLDVSAYVGIAAVGAATLNFLLGTLMVFRYSPVRSWPHRRFNYFRLHNVCGYVALSTAILHPALLLLNHDPKFRVRDLLYPVDSPSQPLENTVGAIAVYVVGLVVVTSYYRNRLGRRLWKAFHFSVYFGAVALFFHSLMTSPDLKSGPIDWLDGGKLFIELCLFVVLTAGIVRWRHFQEKDNRGTAVLVLESNSRRPRAANSGRRHSG
jgi:predicted ferric reductase